MNGCHRASLPVLITAASLLISLSACDAQAPGSEPWRYSTPEQQGFDSAVLLELVQRIETEDLDIHSIVLMRNDHVFFEFYKHPYGPETLQHTMSVGKSVVSTLVGIALEDGQLSGLDEPLLTSFPEFRLQGSDPRKAQITLHDALTMRTGLNVGDEANGTILSDILSGNSWARATWAQNLIAPPGKAFNYSSLVTHLITLATQRAVGRDLFDYATEKLFVPLGASRIQVERDPDGHWFGAGSLWMTSRDMLRFGRLYLNDGVWSNKQIVPKSWVAASTRNQIGKVPVNVTGIADARYGYQWWVFDGAYAAIGVGGQIIMVIPELDLVIVVTRADTTFDLIDGYLLRALSDSFWNWRSNRETTRQLERLTKRLSKPHQGSADQRTAMGHNISGQRFTMASGTASAIYRSFTLFFSEDSSSFKFETDEGELTISLGGRNDPAFSPAGYRAQRPDQAGLIAASAWWTATNKLNLDFHEVGYPIKERWELTFDEPDTKVSVQIRGADQGEWQYVATSVNTETAFPEEKGQSAKPRAQFIERGSP